MLAKSELFPLRFLGFGFFWGWLFLVNLSPSPLFGAQAIRYLRMSSSRQRSVRSTA